MRVGLVRLDLPLLALALSLVPGLVARAGAVDGCVACEAPDAAAMQTRYSESEWTQMEQGDVLSNLVTSEDGGAEGRALASGIVPARADRIWAVLTDWESYPHFMPNVEHTELRRREGDKAWISQHLNVMWNDIRFGVVWDMSPRKGLVLFALDDQEPADIADTRGSWQLVPLGDGHRTLVRYEAQTDVGRPVPDFIRNALARSSLPKVVRSVREEVARRAGS